MFRVLGSQICVSDAFLDYLIRARVTGLWGCIVVLATRGAGTWAYGGNVAGQDLHDADLTDITVQDARAEGANFRGAQLVRFKGVDGRFDGADFAGADLMDSDFEGSKKCICRRREEYSRLPGEVGK